MFYAKSPYEGEAKRNAETVKAFIEGRDITLPENPHFLTHMDECSNQALIHALVTWELANCEDGVHEFDISGRGAVTRLHGPKMENTSLEDVDRWLMDRGANRPSQPVISKALPFQDTGAITIVCFERTLWTIHSGPAMPPEFDHELWESNALAYAPQELDEGKERCYLWQDMGPAGSVMTCVVRHSTLVSHFQGDEGKINDFLVDNHADEVSYTEYLKWGD